VGWRPSITRHLLTLGGDVHRSSLAHRIMHITAPRPAGIRPWAGTAIGSGQEVVQWPTVTLARKRQNCGYDQGTGSGVFQVGQRGAPLNERQPAVPVLGGLLAYPFKAADPRVTFTRRRRLQPRKGWPPPATAT
jgi:hypothetical protein